MASYFRQVPDFDYVNRDSDGKNIGDYQVVKNLFKRVKIRQDILENALHLISKIQYLNLQNLLLKQIHF